MSKKNDISAFKRTGTTKQVLSSNRATVGAEITDSVSRTRPKRVGRPKVMEKRSYKVTLCFTEAEGKVIEKKAGIANKASFLMAKLKETDLLN